MAGHVHGRNQRAAPAPAHDDEAPTTGTYAAPNGRQRGIGAFLAGADVHTRDDDVREVNGRRVRQRAETTSREIVFNGPGHGAWSSTRVEGSRASMRARLERRRVAAILVTAKAGLRAKSDSLK